MAPPKMKIHKNTGKLKSIPRPSSIPSPGDVTSKEKAAEAPPSEADRQFELELYWCIQQLESSLNLPNIRENNKKVSNAIKYDQMPVLVEETSKLINTLKSGSQPIIRKRQIMRTTLGDYRSKMASEQQTMAVNPDNVRFETPKKKNTKYHFIKKSTILTGDTNLKFNFSINSSQSKDTKTATCLEEEKGEGQIRPTKKVNNMVPSGNLFQFNFAVASE